MRQYLNAKTLNLLLWATSVALAAAIGAIAAEGQNVPLALQIANAIAGALAAGQHLPSPRSEP